jgi:tRNA (adenine22-N1)-methyltransferase
MSESTERLAVLAAYVSHGDRVADIGTDHAYLPIHLLRQGISRRAILTDIGEGPLARARENILRAYKNEKIDAEDGHIRTADGEYKLRLGDGLMPIEAGEADTAIIAGMGGELIARILDADRDRTNSIGRYVLQPRTKSMALREYLLRGDYRIVDEDLAEERGRICEIIIASPASSDSPHYEVNDAAKDIFPADVCNVLPEAAQLYRLKEKDHPLLQRFIEGKIRAEWQIADGAMRSDAAQAKYKARVAAARIEALMFVLKFQIGFRMRNAWN